LLVREVVPNKSPLAWFLSALTDQVGREFDNFIFRVIANPLKCEPLKRPWIFFDNTFYTRSGNNVMIRAFWAIELNQEIRSALREFQHLVRNYLPSIGWVRPESLHLTVKFLGEVDEKQLTSLQEAVKNGIKDCSPFSLQVEGVGGFPNMNQPRVLWAGVSGQVADLQRLVSHVEEALLPLGFPSDSKPFRAHLTLARIKQGSREVGRALVRSQALDQHTYFGMLQVHQLCLFRSELKPTGAVYHRLAELPLKES